MTLAITLTALCCTLHVFTWAVMWRDWRRTQRAENAKRAAQEGLRIVREALAYLEAVPA